jgi:AraC-like DNA-binding protein
MAIARTDIFAPIAPVIAAPVDDEAGDALAARIVGHIETTMGWRDETLTIAGLAAQLGEQEYRVRRAINARLGYRNFAAFLNQYRLTEVKAALADPTQRDVPIITIALDAGFGSLGTFNRSFREAEAMTPSEFRAKQSAP